MEFNFATVLGDAARMRPDKAFLITKDGTQHTFTHLHRRAGAAARVLAERGVEPGSRIGLRLPNTVDFVPFYYGLLARGATVFPLNPAASRREVSYIVEDAGVSAIIVLPGDPLQEDPPTAIWRLDELLAEESRCVDPLQPARVSGLDTAAVLYTSGSTGEPKGVELSHLNLLMNPLLGGATSTSEEDEVFYGVLPFYHVYGLSELINGAALRRQTVVVRERFSTGDMLDAIEAHGITHLLAVPTMLHAALAADVSGRDLTSVRNISSGGAPITLEHIRRIRETFPQSAYSEGYGLTESGGGGTVNGVPFEFKIGSVGRAVVGAQVRIVNGQDRELPPGPDHVGEVLMRGPVIMKGYLGRPEQTAATTRDGWLHTGDLGWLDDDGYLYIVGRSKELIIRGGFNVYPNEVEEVLTAHPAISAAAVIGRPDEHYGEEVVAFVVLTDPQAEFSPEDLVEYCERELAPYKCPRLVIVKQQFPLGPSGKVSKLALAEELRAAAGAS